jgi:hypothetical protein
MKFTKAVFVTFNLLLFVIIVFLLIFFFGHLVPLWSQLSKVFG